VRNCGVSMATITIIVNSHGNNCKNPTCQCTITTTFTPLPSLTSTGPHTWCSEDFQIRLGARWNEKVWSSFPMLGIFMVKGYLLKDKSGSLWKFDILGSLAEPLCTCCNDHTAMTCCSIELAFMSISLLVSEFLLTSLKPGRSLLTLNSHAELNLHKDGLALLLTIQLSSTLPGSPRQALGS